MSRLTDNNKTWLLSFVSGQNFYNKKLKNSKDTEEFYTSRLKRYSDAVGKNLDELIALKLEGMQNPATEKEFQAEELLENYLDNCGLTPSAQLGILTAVKSFYSSTRGRDLSKDVGENIEVPLAKKRSPSVDDCVELEKAMTNQRNKFLLWFVESCPTRAGTLRKLVWRDLKPLNDVDVPYSISIEGERLKGKNKGKYKGTKHIGFLHSYAVEKLEAYKLELQQKGIEHNEDSPLFMAYDTNPFGSKQGAPLLNTKAIFRDASLIAWKDLTKKRFSIHDFRDIISTVLENPKVKANVNLGKPLTSHKPSGIEATYANHPDSDYLELFKLCLPFLIPETIGELKTELNQTESTVKKLSEQNKEQSKMLSEAMNTLDEVQTEFEKHEAELEKYKAMFERFGKEPTTEEGKRRVESLKKLHEQQP